MLLKPFWHDTLRYADGREKAICVDSPERQLKGRENGIIALQTSV